MLLGEGAVHVVAEEGARFVARGLGLFFTHDEAGGGAVGEVGGVGGGDRACSNRYKNAMQETNCYNNTEWEEGEAAP